MTKQEKNKAQAPKRRNTRKDKKNQKWELSSFKVPEVEGKTRFHDLDLPDSVMHAIHDLEYQYCSPIQEKVLPLTLNGRDAIGKAQTGTGKTAAFLITAITDILVTPFDGDRYDCEPRVLVVVPTRELAMQVANDAKALCKYTNLHVAVLYGGDSYRKQLQNMQKKIVDIVVATPGRLIDFIARKDIHLDMVESLVLDEADRMLDMGFIPQVKKIIRRLPDTDYRQTQLFSATLTTDIIRLATRWTYEPVRVEVEPENVASKTIEQKFYMVSNEEKLPVLCNILQQPEVSSVIIFTNRRDQSQQLYEKISKMGFNVGMLSGEVTQQKRTRTLREFKEGKLKVLVATDVMGRGIHVDGVSHVINYNLPEDPEDYVHRIGRTGRASNTGIAISLACENEAFQLPAIEELLEEKLRCELPPEELLKTT